MVLTFLIRCCNVADVGVVPLLNMSCHILISTSLYPLFDLIQKNNYSYFSYFIQLWLTNFMVFGLRKVITTH